jgi:tRNA A-37 threonylcarbamoyl transferase component Bud32
MSCISFPIDSSTENKMVDVKMEEEVPDFSVHHKWLQLEKIELPSENISHVCDSDHEQEEQPPSTTITSFTTDPIIGGNVSEDVVEYVEDSGSDLEDDDEVDELLEESMFALQDYFYFIGRIMSHGYVSLYSAVDRKTLNKVCLKLVVRHGITTDIDIFPIEVRVLSCIALGPSEHPGKKHVQHPLCYYSSPSTYVIVSQLYKEASFRRSLFGNPLDIKLMIYQLLQAISYIHSIGIISRDVKNSNILWNKHEKHLVLCDFDLSTFITEQGHKVTLGTDGFIAPEILLHESKKKHDSRYSKEVDIYSAGVVLGSLLNSVRENEMSIDVVVAWRHKLKRIKNKLHPEQDLLRKMLRVDPAKRPSAEVCLQHIYFSDLNIPLKTKI